MGTSTKSDHPCDTSEHMMLGKGQDDVFQDYDANSCGSFNDKEIGEEELAILQKIEAQNRLLEGDTKSLKSISSEGVHSTSRRSSDGSISPTDVHSAVSVNSSNGASQVEDDQWAVWGCIVKDWDEYKRKKEKELKDHVRRGVPRHFRGIVWQLLSGAHESPIKEKYSELLKRDSPSAKLIKRDIARTYPNNDFFKDKVGQEVLFNVTKAYSLVDREVGYCQGSAFIAGLLLLEMPEEDAFAVFVSLMKNYRLRDLFKPSMAELGLCMYQLDSMVQELAPDLHTHFQAQGLHTSMYASSWFLTLFATTFSLQVASRIMDVFMSEGMEVIFRIGLAMLLSRHQQLLELDMEGILTVISKTLPEFYNRNPDFLFNKAFTAVKYNAKKMKKLEKEYVTMKMKESEDQAEMRRLHTENRLLHHRVDALEEENETLADKLIQDRVTRAMEAEEKIKMGKELSIAKRRACLSQNANEDQSKISTRTAHGVDYEQFNAHSNDILPFSSPVVAYTAESENTFQALSSVTDSQESVLALRQELSEAKLREEEAKATLTELEGTISALRAQNKELASSSRCTELQEELIAVKLREAEAIGCLKQLQKKVNKLEQDWQKRETPSVEKRKLSSSGSKLSKAALQELQEELMSAKFRETQLESQNLESRRKLMEFETANQVYASRLKQANKERATLRGNVEELRQREKGLERDVDELRISIAQLENKCSKLQSSLHDASEISNCFDSKSVAPAVVLQPQEKVIEQKKENHELRLDDNSGAVSNATLLRDSDVGDVDLASASLSSLADHDTSPSTGVKSH